MEKLSAWEWFGVYLGVGACMLVLLRLYVSLVLRPPPQSEFVTTMMAAIRAEQSFDWRERAESVLFLPLALLVWPLSIGVGISEMRKPARTYPEPAPAPEQKFRCQREHLRMPTSPLEAEKLGVVTDPLGRTPALPFGHLNAAWLAFLAQQGAGYSLWYFEVPQDPPRHAETEGKPCLKYRGFAWVKARKVQVEFVFEWA